ncbi:hypothetical protein [Nitrososphaera sp.]|uniref:hypothetical protein n=1 Tax=Nitrososphaera sp. TaxID=1971748 RepID=UPI00307D367F
MHAYLPAREKMIMTTTAGHHGRYRSSCRECGHELKPHLLCAQCGEHISWTCSRCGRIDDSTHVHG